MIRVVLRTVDLLLLLGLLGLLSAGIYSFWLDFLHKPSLLYGLLSLILTSSIAWLAGKGLNNLIQRKLDLEPNTIWQPQTAIMYSQVGETLIYPCFKSMAYLLPVYCLLPIFYVVLNNIIFWVLVSLLIAITMFCLYQIKNEGLIYKNWQKTYYPRTSNFIDFYLSIQGEWTDKQEKLFQKIDPSSTDFIVAQQIRAAYIDENKNMIVIGYDYVDTSYGPGFDATPENLAAARQAMFDSLDAMSKTPEHLG